MDQIGRTVSRGFDSLAFTVGHIFDGAGRFLSDALAAADASIHHVLPAAVPSWLVLGALIVLALWVTFRR